MKKLFLAIVLFFKASNLTSSQTIDLTPDQVGTMGQVMFETGLNNPVGFLAVLKGAGIPLTLEQVTAILNGTLTYKDIRIYVPYSPWIPFLFSVWATVDSWRMYNTSFKASLWVASKLKVSQDRSQTIARALGTGAACATAVIYYAIWDFISRRCIK